LSDWDFAVDVRDFAAVAGALPSLVSPLQPLAEQWDPFGECRCYMLTLRGPVKVDLIFAEPQEPVPSPWRVRADTLEAIDRHFWDWFLWLLSKQAVGKTELVEAELQKMSGHLLRPLGAATVPPSLAAALDSYREAREGQEARLGVVVPRLLEHEVLKAWPGTS
jgi:hypothetical protein